MRFRSANVNGFTVFAVTGTNTVSFAIDFSEADTAGLLGFAVERHDPFEDERYFLYGYKVFKSVIPEPLPDLAVSTYDHPVQSFVYDDFTAKPGRIYTYYFHPLKGKPKRLDRRTAPVPVTVETEAAFSGTEHDIFFNRGVVSSQAYRRLFDNKSPTALEKAGEPERAAEARAWLSRDLDDGILQFIADATEGDTLLGCFYEFRYEPVVKALRRAADERGVTLRIIVDAKEKHKPGEEAFPRLENLRMIESAGLRLGTQILLREARKSNIQHNKFIVLLKGAEQVPSEVWTGSTNLSLGAFHGQTNVGHRIRDAAVAELFTRYWQLLATDPGALAGDSGSDTLRKNRELRDAIAEIDSAPEDWREYPVGVTPVFSPRSGLAILNMYAALLDDADDLACITLAFGINKKFKDRIVNNTSRNALTFFLLEKEDKPDENSPEEFVRLSAANNAYIAFGSYLATPLHQWARETTARHLDLNTHVSFIHSKFLLKDPLGSDPIVVTGSANFSVNSTTENDENMVVIRGNQRVADIYFTEFNRLFFHYYYRSIAKRRGAPSDDSGQGSLFLNENNEWLDKYQPGKLKKKRVEAFVKMENTRTLGN